MTQMNEDLILSRALNEVPLPSETIEEEIPQSHYVNDDTGQRRRRRYYPTPRNDQLIWLAAIVLEILIGFRVFLKLIAANPESGFANFVYTVTAPFLAPFAGLTTTPSLNNVVLEVSSIIAMVVYALLFWLALYVYQLFQGR